MSNEIAAAIADLDTHVNSACYSLVELGSLRGETPSGVCFQQAVLLRTSAIRLVNLMGEAYPLRIYNEDQSNES